MEYKNIDWAVVFSHWCSYLSIAVISSLAMLLATKLRQTNAWLSHLT